MTKAGKRLIEGAKEALSIARGEQPAARMHIGGHAYVPEAEVEKARLAERDRAEKMLRGFGEFLISKNKSRHTADLLLTMADAVRDGDAK